MVLHHLVAALLITPSPVPTAAATVPPYADGMALLRGMHDSYQGKWYRTLTFVQTTTLTQPTEHQETWYEAARIPGMLRIDIAPLDSGKAIIFRNDSLYIFQRGQMARSRSFVHPLMVLGFDVYADPPEQTAEKLRGLSFDLSKIREDVWQGRPAYVVGAAAGDTTSAQFWVDRERLVFVRMLEPTPDGSGAIAETQFNRYQPLGKGWIAVECVFTVNGHMVTKEEYADVQGEVTLPEVLFDPAAYARPGWVK